MYGFNCDDILDWALKNSVTVKDASTYASVAGTSELDRLKLIIVAFIKQEERAGDVEEAREVLKQRDNGAVTHPVGNTNVFLQGYFTPTQLRAISILFDKGML